MDPLEKQPDLNVPKVESKTNEDDSLKQIRTYQGDVASAIEKQNETLVSIQRAQAQRNAQDISSGKILSPEEMAEKKSKRTAIWLFIGIIFLISIASIGGWYAYNEYKIKTALPSPEIVPNRFMLTDSMEKFDALTLGKDSLIQTTQAMWTKEIGSGIKQLQLTMGTSTAPISTADFFKLMQSRAPGNLVRAFNPLFMFGLMGGKPNHTFILIKLDSFDNAFPGMIDWEKYMIDDVLALFTPYDVINTIPSETTFKDVTIKNKDARALKTLGGQTVLIYSFYDNNMLIMTDNEETLKALLTKLDSEKLSR